jgi:hypothetical protein
VKKERRAGEQREERALRIHDFPLSQIKPTSTHVKKEYLLQKASTALPLRYFGLPSSQSVLVGNSELTNYETFHNETRKASKFFI